MNMMKRRYEDRDDETKRTDHLLLYVAKHNPGIYWNHITQIMPDETLEDDSKAEMINSLELDDSSMEDLGLTCQYSHGSSVQGYEMVNMKPGYEEAVTIHSLEDPGFTRDEIMKYMELKLGYSKKFHGCLRFVNVFRVLLPEHRSGSSGRSRPTLRKELWAQRDKNEGGSRRNPPGSARRGQSIGNVRIEQARHGLVSGTAAIELLGWPLGLMFLQINRCTMTHFQHNHHYNHYHNHGHK